MILTELKSSNFMARNPLLAYFVLSYAFFWLALTLFAAIVLGGLHLDLNQVPWLVSLIQIAGSRMPSLAAAIVTGTLEGRAGVSRLFGKMIQFRVAARWYLAALIPIGLGAMAVLAYRLSGGLPLEGVSLTPAFWVNLVLVNLLSGPTGEEPGWRGFATPHLMQHFSPIKAGLIVGGLWCVWHLPLFAFAGSTHFKFGWFTPEFWLFLASIIPLGLVICLAYSSNRSSLLSGVIIHFIYNLTVNLMDPIPRNILIYQVIIWWGLGVTYTRMSDLRNYQAGKFV